MSRSQVHAPPANAEAGWRGSWWALAAAGLAGCLYLPTLRFGFVWDDPTVIEQLRSFRSPGDLWLIPDAVPRFYYRPFVFASFLIDRAFSGEQPFWFHATNILLHAGNTLLVALVLRRLVGIPTEVAAAAAFLFAVHPVHVEAVAWVAGRSDLLATLFVLLAVLMHARGGATIWRTSAVCASLFAALLSKESAIAAAVLLPSVDLLQRRPRKPSFYLGIGAVFLLYFGLRSFNLGTPLGGWLREQAVFGLVADTLAAFGVYLAHAFFPGLVTPYAPEVPSSLAYGLLGTSGLVTLAVVFARAPRSAPAFLGLWFLVTLAPALTVVWRTSATTLVADRYLYLPSVASTALLAWGASIFLHRDRKWVYAGLIALVCTLSAWRALSYAQVWRDNTTFWQAAALVAPHDPAAQREVGLAWLERGKLAEAEPYLQRALELSRLPEEQAMARSNLASLHRRRGDFDRAFAELEQAITIAPHPALFHNLGLTAMMAAEAAQQAGQGAAVVRYVLQAKQAFERALTYERDPRASRYRELWNPAKTHALLGQVLFSLNDRAGAQRHLETALALEPEGPTAATVRAYLQRVLNAATL